MPPIKKIVLWLVVIFLLYAIFTAPTEAGTILFPIVQTCEVGQLDWIEVAAKRYGVPIYELMGGKTRDRVRCYMHAKGNTLDETIKYVNERQVFGQPVASYQNTKFKLAEAERNLG